MASSKSSLNRFVAMIDFTSVCCEKTAGSLLTCEVDERLPLVSLSYEIFI